MCSARRGREKQQTKKEGRCCQCKTMRCNALEHSDPIAAAARSGPVRAGNSFKWKRHRYRTPELV
jgi:hypothetical protein